MVSDFELSFEYEEEQVKFSLFLHGITQASCLTSWESLEPILLNAIELTKNLDHEGVSENELLAVWAKLVELLIGTEACQIISQNVPARLTISISESIPQTYYDLFRVPPWTQAISLIADITEETQPRPLISDSQIILNDIRVAKLDQAEDSSIAGIEQVPASMDYYSELEDEDSTGTLFPVWFGTNRYLKQEKGELVEVAGRIESKKVHFGKCGVWIPKSHRRGELKSPWYTPSRLLKVDTIRIRDAVLVNDIVASVHQQIKQNQQTNHLLFIHGFNSSFSDAIVRAAQIGFDLGIDGATIAFSWPSRELIPFVSRYVGDGEVISGCRKSLETLAAHLAGLDGTIHVIAHSMGNRVLTQTWQRIFETLRSSNGLKVGQVIFAAPDVYQQAFRDNTEGIHEFCERATLYANQWDYALGLSRVLSQTPRAGLLPPVMPLKNIETIEVPFNLALFGHTYFAKSIPLLEDIAALIEKNSDPGDAARKSLNRVGKALHWKFS